MRRQEDLVDTHERHQDPRGEAGGVRLKPIVIGALVEQFARRLYGIRFQRQSGWHPGSSRFGMTTRSKPGVIL